jgi:hypothetical protein
MGAYLRGARLADRCIQAGTRTAVGPANDYSRPVRNQIRVP